MKGMGGGQRERWGGGGGGAGTKGVNKHRPVDMESETYNSPPPTSKPEYAGKEDYNQSP